MAGKYWDVMHNFLFGCTPADSGCRNCWALGTAVRMAGSENIKIADLVQGAVITTQQPWKERPRWTGKLVLHRDRIKPPNWRKRRVVAVNWMGDLGHPDVPADVLQLAFDAFYLLNSRRMEKGQPPHILLWLANGARVGRLARAMTRWAGLKFGSSTPAVCAASFYLGATVRSRATAGPAWEALEKYAPGWAPLWLSAEPMSIDASGPPIPPTSLAQRIKWIAAGAETGPSGRDLMASDIRKLRDWCARYKVVFYLKASDNRGGRQLDGREHNDTPWGPA